jgi:hypothetical protein
MNEHEIVEALVREYGYRVRGRLPSGWVLIRPDGSLMKEESARAELEKLTTPKDS